MTPFDHDLEQRLEVWRRQGLERRCTPLASPQSPRVVVQGRPLVNFSSNDYLGLANDERLKEAAVAAVRHYGAGSGASRLICGTLDPHVELERELAHHKGTPAAVAFSSGYAAALGTIGALLGRQDFLVVDRRVHACVIDAARLCGATLRVFAHNDLEDLERILQWCAQRRAGQTPTPAVLIVTESVFSMEGDLAPLPELVALKDRYAAWLMVDEAHATGLYGPRREGCVGALGLTDRVEIQMGTLSKAVGAAGGYICGSQTLAEFLVNRARSFIFSTAPPPAVAAAATAGLRLIQSEEGAQRAERLWQRVAHLRQGLLETPFATAAPSAIVPVIVGDERRALDLAARLRTAGLWVPAIRYPTVARGAARLRVTLSAAHTAEDVTHLLAELHSAAAAPTAEPPAAETTLPPLAQPLSPAPRVPTVAPANRER